MLANKINTVTLQQAFIKRFYCNKMHYNYKLDENIFKTLIQKNILPTDPYKKNKSYHIL